MSAKLLYSLSDENPDLQKQIGCMNGIFQLFDRHHFLSGRRVVPNRKRLPPGEKGYHETKPNSASQRSKEKNLKKEAKEKQRISTESSRTSFSSSSCSSSLSSIDCSKQSQPEPSSSGRINIPGTPTRDLHVYEPNDSLLLSRQPVDLRDVVKESMYREARGISIKTAAKENAGGQTLKYMDSPRPFQQPKSVKSRVSGLNESFQVRRDVFPTKDAPRFSYDGRESRDTIKSTIKLKELPRLSLDSRVRSMRCSSTEMKSNYLLGDLQRGNGTSYDVLSQQQELGSYNRPSSVVVKLMGLEAFPDSMSTNGNRLGQMKTIQDVECDSFSRISSTTDGNKQKRISGSPRNSSKEPVSPRMKNADSLKKPIASSKFPMEPAPWKQPSDGSRGQTPALKRQETTTKAPNSSLSVYGEIEKRLAQIEFKKSGKDLRALKQILEAMQKTKEMLESRKEDQASEVASQTGNNSVDQSPKLANLKNLKSSNPTSTTIKGTSSPKSFKSPIVIMRSGKFIEKDSNSGKFIEKDSNSSSSVILAESLSGLQRFHICDSADSRKESVNKRTTKDSPRDPSSRQLNPINKNASANTLRSAQNPKNPQPATGKTKLGKSSEPMNPRLKQKKLGLEKQSHTTNPSSASSLTRRQPIESGSPHRTRSHSPYLPQSYDQMSDISSDARDLSPQGDANTLQSESNISMASHVDTEVTSVDRSDKINGAIILQHHQKDPAARYVEDRSMAEPARAAPEQPSPVSVLDATFDRDEPLSPVKKIPYPFKDDEDLNSDEAEWSMMDLSQLSNCKTANSSEDQKEADNPRHLDLNLMHINPTRKKSIINEITPIYNSTDPNHKYISEILLASGLLRDSESGLMTIQLHPSDHLINPNLFLVLEQTKSSARLLNNEHKGKKTTHSEPEKAQRKLVFDAVNEILVHKLVLENSSKQWFSSRKRTEKKPRGLQLLRDLCSDVDRLQAKESNCSLDDEDDNLKSLVWDDLMHESVDWTHCNSEISWLVLDVERLIFKDLISEVVRDEIAPRGQPGRHCRQLFAK